MKLSRTAWNNVIIFSVMIIILLINATNDKLFPNEDKVSKAERFLLPEHSVILTLEVESPTNQSALFERIGRSWQLTTKGVMLEKTDRQIEQMMFAWQQSQGLVQAAEIIIDDSKGVEVTVALANETNPLTFTLYPLADQLLLYNQQDDLWLALPPALAQQLIPITL